MVFFVVIKVKSISTILSDLDDNLKKAGKAVDDVAEMLVRVLKKLQDRLSKLSVNDLNVFKKDLNDSEELLKYFDNAPNPEKLVDAWETLVKHPQMRKNIPVIDKLSELLNDTDFMSKLPNGKKDLEDILDAVKNPLKDGTEVKLIKLTDYIDNLRSVVKKHSGVEGFNKLMVDLKNPAFAMQDGVTHMLNGIKDIQGKIKKFDYEFEIEGTLCTKCRFDVEVDALPKLIEYKSWDLKYIDKISSKQLGSYFSNASSIDDIQYVFNKLKTPNVDLIKEKMQILFYANTSELFDEMSNSLRKNLNVKSLREFNRLIKDTNSKLYDFIDIN